ncbi:serine protease 45-like [Onthophagus taurus]|uniref:serine protease 45-like n=1 Tax=Onthophagus taurus TaxID=166361 RepID=UPI0039BDD97D
MSKKILIAFTFCSILSICISQKSDNDCILPEHPPNAQLSLTDKKDYIPNTFVPTSTTIKITCNPGYTPKNFRIDGISYCIIGKWRGDLIENPCQKSCQLHDYEETMDFDCSLNSKKINCSESTEGTKIVTKCKPFFNSEPRTTSTCSNDQWTPEIRPCNLECGLVSKPQILVVQGASKETNILPWVISITKNNDPICLGSLISHKHVLSAAHCFVDFNGDVSDTNNYKVIANENENKQIREVEKVFVHEKFRGMLLNYINDIAVIVVKSFVINLSIQPVCFDDNENSLTKNIEGIAFGVEEKNKFKLEKLIMKFEDKTACKEKLPQVFFEHYYMPDKFCASFSEKRNCGLSGSGFYTKSNGKYYIRGILTLAPATANGCNATLPSLLTSISSHFKWLKEIMKNK